jgi:O-antigen ligase/polysaccharide polymerase Wzy-like membrane protein
MAASDDNILARYYPLRLPSVTGNWQRLATVLIVGYLAMGKSFAYLGLPWISVYIGEIALAAFVLFGPAAKQGQWLRLVRRVRQLRRLKRLLVLLLVYGALEAVRGILHGYPAITAARDTAFNYYPLFLLLGIWTGLRDRGFLCRVIRILALCVGCYGLAWILFLSRITWTIPGTGGRVPLFLGPYGGYTVALLGLVAFEQRLRGVWHLILLNTFVLLGSQSRADWLGLAVGLLALAWVTKRVKPLAVAGGFMILFLGLMYVTDLSILSPTGRGEKVGTRISADSLIARAAAPLSKDLAARLAPPETVSFAFGTTEWRLLWWANIWAKVHARLSSALFGFGYGYPIGDLNPDIESGTFIQTPHNDVLYALAYSGWLGVALFVLFQVELFRLLLRSYTLTGQPFGLMCWAALLTTSLFEDFFEAPFGAIPAYLLLGAAMAPALLAWRRAIPNEVRSPLPCSPLVQRA